MKYRVCRRAAVVLAATLSGLAPVVQAATFGDVVAIGGQAADIALDEARGVLYIANFTAGRIDVLSLADNSIGTSIHVAPGPASLALSPDGRYLVATHFGNVAPPGSPTNAVTVLDRVNNVRQTLVLDAPPLGVAFGFDGLALIATTSEFLALDPASGTTALIDTVAGVTANSLPAAPGTPPVQIVAASLAASGDGRFIFGLSDTLQFRYDVAAGRIAVANYSASPALGPRVISAARDGSYYAAGWAVFGRQGGMLMQFANPSGLLAVGSVAVDSVSGTIYAQMPDATAAGSAAPPTLLIADADNLTIRERLVLPENLTGRALLNAAADRIYAVSDSGVAVLRVGSLAQSHRLAADHEDVVFHGSECQRGVITQTLRLVDPSGGRTAFSLSSDLAGLSISPSSGWTPATVQLRVDPASFQGRLGTTSGLLTISSAEAVNLPSPVRILVNNQRPDDRGTATDVPGTLVDLLADPVRDRFYVLRQDRNQVLVFDGSALSLLATLRTGNTPTRMAITADRKFLIVGHENSQLAYVYDLDSLQPSTPVVFPAGHYPRSIGVSGNAILAASRVVGPANTIDRIDLTSRTAATPTSLGVFRNSIHVDTALAGTPNGSAILAASADGNVMLYDASADTFTVSRKLPASLAGAYAASGSSQFVAGNYLLNASLTPSQVWTGTDFPSGFAFVNGQGLRLTAAHDPAGPSVIGRIDLATGSAIRPTRVVEQPLAAAGASVFTRTLAPLANGNTVIALTASGFTALAWSFDSPVPSPSIDRVTNAADFSTSVAAGSLITVFGANLSPTNLATHEVPLPTAIGESCLTVNGSPVPMLFASPGQINAQLPIHIVGRVTMTLYTPGGVGDDYYLDLLPAAPAIFHSGVAGPFTGIPVVVKDANQQLVTASNPIHPGDEVVIYAAGLGSTSPEVEAGTTAPFGPLAAALLVPDVRLGGSPMSVSYAGLAPGEIGVYQINAKAPAGVPAGSAVPLTIAQAGASTSVSVRVVE